jgi:hypothetical protein
LLVSALRLVRKQEIFASPPKLIVGGAQARSRRFETFLWRQRLLHFHPFEPSRFESISVSQCPGVRV